MKNLLLIFLLSMMHLQVLSQQEILQQKINTNIRVALNDRQHTLDGYLELEYLNNSPDTLYFIWFNLWPNAFKNDRTAFNEYMLEKDRTDFYFSDKQKRGYINRLDFRSNDIVLKQEDHPQYIDLVKVYLDRPLAPGSKVFITTPFHVKLPYNFDGIGYKLYSYQIRYWYPAPAEYSGNAWHPSPYEGEVKKQPAISDFDVAITLPERFVVRGSGQLRDSIIADSLKTLRFTASGIHDFSFAIEKSKLSKLPPNKGYRSYYDSMINPLSYRFFPLAGYNRYDGLQLGMLIHEPDPERKFAWFAIPMFALESKKITGTAGLSYLIKPGKTIRELETGLSFSSFSTMDGRDSAGKKIFADLYKFTPFIRVSLPSISPKIIRTIEFKSFIIAERNFKYSQYSVDSFYYPYEGSPRTRYVNQLSFNYAAKRALYPYDAQLQLQQGESFYRLNATSRYFFNYSQGGGMNLRLFAAKFGYLGSRTLAKKFDTYLYQPKLTAVRGNEDYTYGDYFFGRNEFEGFNSHQIMMRDGDLKLRTDLFQDLQGRSDNWVASMNLNTTLPDFLPFRVPLRVFLDVGTFAEAWKRETSNPRFLYVAGLQLSLFKEFINIYAPLLYSNQFRDRLKSVPEENKLFNRISFSLDVQRFKLPRCKKKKIVRFVPVT